jgi:hypothetical protein
LAFDIFWTGEFYLLGYNAMYFVESQPTFRRNMSATSSRSKNKPSKKPAWKHATTLVSCLAYSSTYVGWLSTNYTALYPRR